MTRDVRLQAFIKLCRDRGLKVTPQRIEIYRELTASAEHPDAETIYRRVKRRLPAISFNTVYQTLRKLQQNQIIMRVGMPAERARFDADLTRHHHFICERCGAIRDFRCEEYDRLPTPAGVRSVGVPRLVWVEIQGICNTCRERSCQACVRRRAGKGSAEEGGEIARKPQGRAKTNQGGLVKQKE